MSEDLDFDVSAIDLTSPAGAARLGIYLATVSLHTASPALAAMPKAARDEFFRAIVGTLAGAMGSQLGPEGATEALGAMQDVIQNVYQQKRGTAH